MGETAGPRGLAEHLRSMDDAALITLLRSRPDLATPVPADLSVLATRAQSRLSIARALEQLDQFTLEILDAVRLLADRTTPLPASANEVPSGAVTLTEVLTLTSYGSEADEVQAAVGKLRSLALVWGEDSTLHPVTAISEVAGPYPSGLGRPVGELLRPCRSDQLAPVLEALQLPASRQPEASAVLAEALTDQIRLRALFDQAPAEARDILSRLAVGPPLGSVQDARRTPQEADDGNPLRWLLGRGLLVAVGEDTVELPRELGLLLRGDTPLGTLHPYPPLPSPASQVGAAGRSGVGSHADPSTDPSAADSAGAGQVLETVRIVETLLAACDSDPPAVLRGGGLGIRELRRLARAVNIAEPAVVLLLEVSVAAGLLADSGEADPLWLPTPAYDLWQTGDPASRWEPLVTAWLGMPRLPALAGQRDEKDRLVPVLSPDAQRPGAPGIRRAALDTLASRPPGTRLTEAEVLAMVSWHAPRRGGRGRDEILSWTLAEAATLGITGRGAITTAGRVLLSDRGTGADAGISVADAVRNSLPEPLDYVLAQPDLTVVAPGPLVPDLAAELGLVAEVESAGAATVYRVTPDSVRRALDAGRSSADLHSLFAQRSRTQIPQALTYLIDDTARRHGGLRVGNAGAYLRGEDIALLASVAADRRCESLNLRSLAPTVLVSSAPVARLLDVLRGAGYAPMAEDAAGGVLLSRAETRRASGRRRIVQPGADLPFFDDHRLLETVRAIRISDEAARNARRSPVTRVPGVTTAATLALLKQAAAEGVRIWLGYADTHGGIASRVIRPISLNGGFLRAADERTEVLHTFALHRIISAALIDE